MERFELLDKSIVDNIKTFLKEEKDKRRIPIIYPNVILRNDVLQILDAECTVIYYPLLNESNNGFHISGIDGRDGQLFNFVFINTHQTIEKQIFTAAHELGHAWKIEDYVVERQGKVFDEIDRERIVNRFAAELLMPEYEFREQYRQTVRKYVNEQSKISFKDFLKLVASLMYFFLAPMKAVLVRLAEMGFVSVDTINKFISSEPGNVADIIKQSMERIIKEEGYTELFKPTDKKYIEGLTELLEMAEARQTVSSEKIRNMRVKFGLDSEAMDNLPEQDILLDDGIAHEKYCID